MAEEIKLFNETLVLVKRHSYGWDFYPVIGRFDNLTHGFVVIDNRGVQSIVNFDDVYTYFLEDEIEEERFYFLDDAIIWKMGERK